MLSSGHSYNTYSTHRYAKQTKYSQNAHNKYNTHIHTHAQHIKKRHTTDPTTYNIHIAHKNTHSYNTGT